MPLRREESSLNGFKRVIVHIDGSFRRKLVDCNPSYGLFFTILGGILIVTKLSLILHPPSSSLHNSYAVGARRHCDWWDCPEKLPVDRRVFNKSILYLKPHKTGSETFKEILSRVGEYYDLTTDKELELKLQRTEKQGRRTLLKNQYDVLLRHSRYRKGVTEKRIRGWSDSNLGSQERNSTTQREMIKVVTIRNPIDRLFSHYFSKRRFKNFTPKRGFVRPGRLSEEEEISDFLEWLTQYEQSQQIFYSRDVASWEGKTVEGKDFLAGIDEIVDFYDHVIVVDQWKLSICVFGLIERIHPSLMVLNKRNKNERRARRFRKSSALANRALYRKVLEKIEYDFLLYSALMKKFDERLLSVNGSELGRYCDKVGALAEEV